MTEFLVGLFCVVLLLAGLHQASVFSAQGFESMRAARYGITRQYVDPDDDMWCGFNFAGPTSAGADGQNFTADDRHSGGFDDVYQNNNHGYLSTVYDDRILGYMEDAALQDPNIELEFNNGVYSGTTALDMVHGEDQREVGLVLFLKNIFDRESVLIRRSVWMPRWDRIK